MGKKDACYHKVIARYRVFPSAYASGAIAKCRKVGAANYGTGGKKKKSTVKKASNGGYMKAKRPTKVKNIARGCGAIMSNRRKKTRKA
mgnify:CR=1 FL=1